MFSDFALTKYKTVPAIKEEVKTVNFNWYEVEENKKLIEEIKQIPLTDKIR